jgi:hypothetical protein
MSGSNNSGDPLPRADVTQVVSSCDETLLLTTRGEVLVCRHFMPRMPRRTTMTTTSRGRIPPTTSHPTAAMRTNYNSDSVVDTNDATHTAVSSIETNDRRINLKSSAAMVCRSKETRLEEKQYTTDDTSCIYCGESSRSSNPPPLMSTAAMNGNNNYYYNNNNNHNSNRNNGGTMKQPRNDDNDQYNNCNYIDYFTNNLNNNEDRVYGGSYDDNIHGYNNAHGTNNNNNHAGIVLSSSSWPGMNRAVDIDIDEDNDDDDDEVVDELSDLIGISLNGYGGSSNNSNNGGRGDDDDDVNEDRNLSPTPLMSFDYNGYEPPTPVRNNNDNIGSESGGGIGGGGGNIFFPQQQQQDDVLLVPPPNLDNEDGDDDSHDMNDYTTIIQQTTKDYASSQLDNSILAYLPGSGGRASYCSSIPTYLHQLSQIVITKISAHPQGHHVLLISAEGLLFSYGSNRYGQLGIGNQSINQTHQQQIQTTNDRHTNANGNNETTKAITDTNHGQRKSATTTMMMPQQQQQSSNTNYSYYQHSIPTIVTPLLENGGKTINCAAGIDYSLVVVKTECIRIKYQSPQRLQHQQQQHHNRTRTSHHHHHRTVATTSAQQEQQHEYHHQMYGFGNNHDRKLGLLDPDRAGSSSSSSSSSSQHHRSTTTANNRISALLPGSPNSIGSLGDVSCNTEDTAGSSSSNCYKNNNNNTATTATTFDEFTNCVFLPRRVALHCRVRHEKQSQSHTSSVSSTSLTEVEAVETESSSSSKSPPPYGIFSIAASVEHSSALVKRPSGDIEVYTWGGGGIINMSPLPTTTTTTTKK